MATVKKPGEEQVKFGKVKGLAAVKKYSHRSAALAEIVLEYLMDQPGGSTSAAPLLESKLQRVRIQLVAPHH